MHIVVPGGSGGIGSALINALLIRNNSVVIDASFNNSPPAPSSRVDPRVRWTQVDLASESSVAAWLQPLHAIDWLINCAGLLHTPDQGPEKSLRDIDAEFFTMNMQANCLPTLLLAKHSAAALKRASGSRPDHKPALFATVSAKVGSIEDNRLGGWYSYRASKAALNMSLKTLAIEWQRQAPRVCVASLHPGTTDTDLSKPFQKNVSPEALFSTSYTAEQLLGVLDSLTAAETGRFWAWNGEELPW